VLHVDDRETLSKSEMVVKDERNERGGRIDRKEKARKVQVEIQTIERRVLLIC
jgi:hypothetical protein